VNAVARLARDMICLDLKSCEQFELFFFEAARIGRIIRALIDACLGLQDEIQRAGAPLFEYPLIPEGEGQEGRADREAVSPSSTQNIVTIALTSLQAGSLGGALGEAFGGFASQTAALADVYNPLQTPEVPSGTLTGRAEDGTVLEKLTRSASVLQNLKSVRTDLARTLVSQKSTMTGFSIPAHTGTSRGDPGLTEKYPEPLDTMFTTLHGMLQRSERMADIPFPATVPLGHPPLPPAAGPGREIPAPQYQGLQEKPLRRTGGSPYKAPGTGIIEVPSLVPAGVLTLRTETATANAARLSEGIARLSGGGTAQPDLPSGSDGVPSSVIRLSRGTDSSSPLVSIPGAFEKIAQYLTYSSDIRQQLMAPLSGGISVVGPGPGIFSVPLPFTGSDAGGGVFPGFMLQGKDIRSAGDTPVMNLAVSMATGEVMRRANLFVHSAENSPLPGMFSGSTLSGAAPVSSLSSLERALPLYAGSRGETAPPATGSSTTVHFQNTFNITVRTMARGDETELRELGRKIGVILSDEMKRYGGLR
jgi:hypothetical protein